MSKTTKGNEAKVLLLCMLPILLFFILSLFGVILSPGIVSFLLIVCFFAMFNLLAGACESHEAVKDNVVENEASFDKDELVRKYIEKVKDVFQVRATHYHGLFMEMEGEFLLEPEKAYEMVFKRFESEKTTPMLQESGRGKPTLLFTPHKLPTGEYDDEIPGWHILLFFLTLATTTWAGALHQGVNLISNPEQYALGLPYSLGLLLILGAHEMGHYFAALFHRMKVSLPYFIPIPFGLGTFGAFIKLKSPAPNRRALFDMAVAGPIAGLVFAIPVLYVGLQNSMVVDPTTNTHVMLHSGANPASSILFAMIAKAALGDALQHGHTLALHPLAFAGWLGLIVTALNLLPIGQLDGGHISDAMFGTARSISISTAAMISLFFLGIFVWSGFFAWAFIAFFVAGEKGLPPLNNVSLLGGARRFVGMLSYILLFLILVPVPHGFYESFGIHCPYL